MKILASDFDNTIFMEQDAEQTKKNAEAIRKFMQAGNLVCIISGRNYTSLKQFLIRESIPYTYLVCEDGAKIFDNTDYPLATTFLDPQEVEQIVSILEKNGYNHYLDDGYNRTIKYDDCVKIVMNCADEEEQKKIIEFIKSTNNVHIYASRYHINIINNTVNKEEALRRLVSLENLSEDNLYVIGDNDNDYEMLKAFQGGVMKEHNPILDELQKKEYNSLSDFIEELMKD